MEILRFRDTADRLILQRLDSIIGIALSDNRSCELALSSGGIIHVSSEVGQEIAERFSRLGDLHQCGRTPEK